MIKLFLLIPLVAISITAMAQQKFTISGTIADAATNEALIGANTVELSTYKGTVTNNYGFYSLTLPAGKIKVAFSFVGYETLNKEINLTGDQKIDVALVARNELQEIEVVATKANERLSTTQMSRFDMPIDKIKSLPALLGEPDVIKSLQLLPGVKSGSEGSSGLYVRGGAPDQNLLLLDGVPIYNASHLFGFFSVFNPDALKSVSFYKGGFPARFGGRLSSVVDVRMKEGNGKEYHGNISVGLISSSLHLEGPIAKERTSFSVSARRTYVDLLTMPFKKSDGDIPAYYFYDVNAKINHRFSDRSRLFLSTYIGKDNLISKTSSGGTSFQERMDKTKDKLNWGNITSSLRWNYIFNNKLFSNTTVTYSKYDFEVSSDNSLKNYSSDKYIINNYLFGSGIYDWGYKMDFDYSASPNHAVKFGLNYIYHNFKPGVKTYKTDATGESTVNKTYGDSSIYAHDFSVYAEDDITIGPRLKANVGLRASTFNVQNTPYYSLEPRLSVNYQANDNLSFKVAYSQMKQYIHLLTSSRLSLPTDLWVPVTAKLKPMTAEQVAIGAVYRIAEGMDLTVESYYKKMNNLIEYKDGASFYGSSVGWENKVETGKGWAYGTEVMFSKEIGKTTGWVAYTLSWADRQFENISFGQKFPAKYDSRHDINIVVSHKFNNRIDIGSTWVYHSGNAGTLFTNTVSTDFPNFDNRERLKTYYFDGRNNYRMPPYHRLDFGINFHKQKRTGVRTWNVSVYNVYNRQNPYFITFDTKSGSSQKMLKQVSLFSIIPSITYSFKF